MLPDIYEYRLYVERVWGEEGRERREKGGEKGEKS
jgi:hypothetical protein